eukprot:355192-Chlamydomonas_euryale.AAC.4
MCETAQSNEGRVPHTASRPAAATQTPGILPRGTCGDGEPTRKGCQGRLVWQSQGLPAKSAVSGKDMKGLVHSSQIPSRPGLPGVHKTRCSHGPTRRDGTHDDTSGAKPAGKPDTKLAGRIKRPATAPVRAHFCPRYGPFAHRQTELVWESSWELGWKLPISVSPPPPPLASMSARHACMLCWDNATLFPSPKKPRAGHGHSYQRC